MRAWREASSRRDDGASSVEYGLIVFAIAAMIATVVFALGPPVRGLFDSTCRTISGEIVHTGGTTTCT